MLENRCNKWGFYFIMQQWKSEYNLWIPIWNPINKYMTLTIREKNSLTPQAILALTFIENWSSKPQCEPFCVVSYTCDSILAVIKLSSLSLLLEVTLPPSGRLSRPLETELTSSWVKLNCCVSLRIVSALLLHGSLLSLVSASLDLENLLRIHCPFPSLTTSISSYLTTNCCYSRNWSTKEIRFLVFSSMFSKCPSTSSYNPLLEHQWPRLKFNRWLGSTWNRSVWFSRWFSPLLN